jgi:AraC family transcriptional activator of pobA
MLVEERFRVDHHAAAYASALSVSADHLSAVARRFRGRSVKAIVQHRIHAEARRLLLHTDMDIAEIAFALGFNEPAHFSRAFRAASGMAPRRFRARTAEKYR